MMVLTAMAWSGVCGATAEFANLAEFQARAAKFDSVVTIPQFETTPESVWAAVRSTTNAVNAALDRIGGLSAEQATFRSTIVALDDLAHQIGLTANRLSLLKETSTNAAVRDAATDAMKALQDWAVGVDYREDVYRAVRAYAATKPRLKADDRKLFEETLRDYRRAGLELGKAQRDEVERLRKQLAPMETDFESNVTKAKAALRFTKADLDGVPDSFLQQVKTGDDEYTVMANVTWHFITVQDNAKKEETRKRLLVAHDSLAREENIPLLEKILVLRDTIARKLGYPSWADYATETKMVKNAATAMDFLNRLKTGLQPKFAAEIAEFQKIKARETGNPNAKVEVWDWRYLSQKLKQEKYDVDAEALRVYFPYQRVLDGMFAIYQKIFGLKFERVEPPYKWIDDLQLYAVSDSRTREPLGLFYLDMFPREGKYNHFAQFGIVEGKRLPSGKYQRPTVALVCNFPSPASGQPSLLTHNDVETLFHEFGHAMHSILTRAKYSRFAGTSVPRDFVEAPSQMLENWVWDKDVLDTFAADYRDPAKKIPAEILAKLKESRLSTEATRYRRQISFGLTDLALHTRIHEGNAAQVLPLSNEILSEVFFPLVPGTAFVAYFGHLIGYDAGYYGYAWADAISADMATVFEKAKHKYFDEKAGRRLRKEIYEPGASREVNLSIEKFLGRKRSLEPFFRNIGMEKGAATPAGKAS
jgi:thimet oligopeptidase